VIWSVFEKVSQSTSRLSALDKLVVTVHSVKMPVGFGKHAITSRGTPLFVMAHIKKSIVEVKAEEKCLAYALVIAIANVDKDPNYKAYILGRKIGQVVQTIPKTTGIDMSNGAGIPELVRLQEHFREYMIVVYHGLNCDYIIFEGQVDSPKRLYIQYDNVERNYHVIANLTAAMAVKCVCKRYHKSCKSDITHVCDQTCSDCMACPRASSLTFESPALNAIRTLELTRVSPTTIRALKRNVPCVKENDVARSMDGS